MGGRWLTCHSRPLTSTSIFYIRDPTPLLYYWPLLLLRKRLALLLRLTALEIASAKVFLPLMHVVVAPVESAFERW